MLSDHRYLRKIVRFADALQVFKVELFDLTPRTS